jgi:serine/threonine protein kinase
MKVLFLIPKNDSPILEGDTFSTKFKDFVAVCLKKNPQERPSAANLLQHPFIKSSKHLSHLTELVERCMSVQDQDSRGANIGSPNINDTYCGGFVLKKRLSCQENIQDMLNTSGKYIDNEGIETMRGHASELSTSTVDSTVDSGWDFNTVRLTGTAVASELKNQILNTDTSYEDINSSPVPSKVSDAGVCTSSMEDTTTSTIDHSHVHDEDEEQDDERVFMQVVKPAVFQVLQEEDVLTGDGSNEIDMEEKEDLLFEFLHAFENLTRQKGLLTKVLDCVVAHAITAKTAAPLNLKDN